MNADDIARYLRIHPEFFDKHPELLEQIKLPHPYGGRAIPWTGGRMNLEDVDGQTAPIGATNLLQVHYLAAGYTHALTRRLLGGAHPDTVSAMTDLAGVEERLGELHEAELLFEEALAIRRRTLGERAERTLEAMRDLALLYAEMGRDAEAEPLLQELVAALPQDSPERTDRLEELGRVRARLGK